VLDLLGIVYYYLDDTYKRRAIVLSLRNTLGSYTSSNIADYLLQVIRDFLIDTKKIAYFIADNASNNDKALTVLSSYLPSM
jgi:hypothetical protein